MATEPNGIFFPFVCSSVYPFNGHFVLLETQDGVLGYKPCTKNVIDVHSAYTLFGKAPHDTVKTVTLAAKEICKTWNELYSRPPKASADIFFLQSKQSRPFLFHSLGL